jgi:uncharacterized protein
MAAPSKPPVIDALEFARKGLAIHDTIALSQFSRLSDALAPSDGKLNYALQGRVDAEGRPRLRLQMQGKVPLTCQRCMEPLEFAVDVDTDFILVVDEDMIPSTEEDDEMDDYLVAGPQMRVAELLEEELLLALPFAPKHEDECADKAGLKMQTEKQSPFAVLKGLKTRDQD